MSNIAVLIPNEEKIAARLFTKNDVPFLDVPTKVTIFLSGVNKLLKLDIE